MKIFNVSGVISICTLLFLSGCAPVTYIEPDKLTLNAPDGVVLPLDELLEVYLPPDIDSRLVNHNGVTVNEGTYTRRAAMDTFPKVFSEVKFVSSPSAMYLATVKAVESNVSSFSGIHNVSIQVDFNQLDGDEIGSFTGKGSVLSGRIFEYTALSNAFVEAYMDVLDHLIKSEQFVDKFASSQS